MTSSYEELTPESKEQVDAFISNISAALYWPGSSDEYVRDYVREHASNLVLSCLYIETKHEAWKRGAGKEKATPPIVLTQREWKSLSRAFLNLYEILRQFPTSLDEHFRGRKHEYRDVERWEERLSR